MAYQSINPLNGELLQKFDQHTDAQMESALAKADSTFQHVWSKATFRDRAKIVGRAASLMLNGKRVWLASPPLKWARGSRKAATKWR